MDVQTISIVIAAASVVIAALATIIQNRKTEKSRKTELLAMLFSPFNDPVLVSHWNEIVNHWKWKDYDDYWEKYGQKNIEASKLISTASFFNSLGLLVKMGLLDIDIVRRWSPEACLWFWEKTKPIFFEARKRLKAAGRAEYRIWKNVEYLYDEMQKREQTLQAQH